MMSLKRIIPAVFILMILGTTDTFAQRRGGGGHRGGGGGYHGEGGYHGGYHGGYGQRFHGPRRAMVVHRSPFRPAKIIVYHPVWGPQFYTYRRWVFFPRFNIYWDNWRNQYVFWNGTIWLSQPTPPPVIVNVNLENEKHYDLKKKDDDTDDIYQDNAEHKEEYKPE